MCYVVKKQEKQVYLSDKMAIELALTTEIPIDRPISLFEIAVIIWGIQSRPWYNSELVSILKIREILDEIILYEPRKIIELENEKYLVKYV